MKMRTARAMTLLLCTACWVLQVHAGGPLLVGGEFDAEGLPFRWSTTVPVPYHTDLGGLGTLDKTAADALTAEMFGVWQAVPTAKISYSKTGDLSVDVTSSNIVSELNNASSELNTKNAIIYDTNGGAIDALAGSGASNFILGFAGPGNLTSDGVENRITQAIALLNGKFIDGAGTTEIPLEKFKEAFVHEFGHFSGLDHSQINVNALETANRTADNLGGLPTMFPFLLNTAARPTLAPDDIAAISELYPEASFASSTGRIRGRIFFSDGAAQAQGYNVIARQVDNLGTPENESRRIAVSSVSGFRFTASAGNTLLGGASSFGSRNPSLIGFYDIPGLPAGNYMVEVEALFSEFTGGSGVGPIGGELGFQYPMSGVCAGEFLNQSPPESDTDSCSASTALAVSAGAVVETGTDIILNGTPPTYDAWESARLWWPQQPALHRQEMTTGVLA